MDRPNPDSRKQTLDSVRQRTLQFWRQLFVAGICSVFAGTCVADPGSDCEFRRIDPQGAEVDGAWNGMTPEFGPGHALLDIYNPTSPTADTFHAVLNRPAPALARLCNGHMSNTVTLDVRPLPSDPPLKVYLDSLGCVDLIASKATAAVTRCPFCGDLELPKYSSTITCANTAAAPPPARTISALYGVRQSDHLGNLASQPWITAATRFSLPLDETNHPILISARKVRMELCLDTDFLTTIEVHADRLGPATTSEGFSSGCTVIEGRQLWLRPHRISMAQVNTVLVPNRYGPPIAVLFPSIVPRVDLNAGSYIRGRYRILEIRPD